jgi:hypothetical protein
MSGYFESAMGALRPPSTCNYTRMLIDACLVAMNDIRQNLYHVVLIDRNLER